MVVPDESERVTTVTLVNAGPYHSMAVFEATFRETGPGRSLVEFRTPPTVAGREAEGRYLWGVLERCSQAAHAPSQR